MKLVEFENGKFGVRVYWFFGWHFRDLISDKKYNWSRKDSFFRDCQGTHEKAEYCFGKKFKKKYMGYKLVPTKEDIIKKEMLVKKKNTAQNPTGKRMIQL